MKRWTWTTALVGAALASLVAAGAGKAQTAAPDAPAAAQPTATAPVDAAPAPKKAKRKASSGLAVTIMNSRAVDLTELQAAASGSDKFMKVLGKLKAGQKAGATVAKGKDCRIDLHATFADGETTEATGVDVCTQKILNLTD